MPKATHPTPRTPRRPAPKKTPTKQQAPAAATSRPMIVGASLLAALGLTAGLLAWASPSPLVPDAAGRLFAADETPTTPDGPFAAIFQTARPVAAGRWTAIYVHQSKTSRGDAATLAEAAAAWGVAGPPDHFVVGNGLGAGDGEVQFTPRWDEQRPAAPPAAGATIDPACISICLVGDFDRARPTDAQLQRLSALLSALSRRLDVPPERIHVVRDSATAAGVGSHFPPLR